MKETKVAEVAKEIIDKYNLTYDQQIVIFECSPTSVRSKKCRNSYTFEDVARLCLYTGEDLIEKARYIFGDEWLERIKDMNAYQTEIRRLKREIAKLKGQLGELENG